MTGGNDRFARNQDEDDPTPVRGRSDVDDDTFASFAAWVNNPVSPYAKHNVPDDLRRTVEKVDDHKERERLRSAVEAFEDGTLSPRVFVQLVMQSDEVDYFDPLSTPEGWGKDREDHGPPEVESGKLLLTDDPDDMGDPDTHRTAGDDVTELPDDLPEPEGTSFDARPDLDADVDIWPVVVGLLIAASIAFVVFVL